MNKFITIITILAINGCGNTKEKTKVYDWGNEKNITTQKIKVEKKKINAYDWK